MGKKKRTKGQRQVQGPGVKRQRDEERQRLAQERDRLALETRQREIAERLASLQADWTEVRRREERAFQCEQIEYLRLQREAIQRRLAAEQTEQAPPQSLATGESSPDADEAFRRGVAALRERRAARAAAAQDGPPQRPLMSRRRGGAGRMALMMMSMLLAGSGMGPVIVPRPDPLLPTPDEDQDEEE